MTSGRLYHLAISISSDPVRRSMFLHCRYQPQGIRRWPGRWSWNCKILRSAQLFPWVCTTPDVRTGRTFMERHTQKLKYITPQVTTPDSGIPRKTREAINPAELVQAAIVMIIMAPILSVTRANTSFERLTSDHAQGKEGFWLTASSASTSQESALQ